MAIHKYGATDYCHTALSAKVRRAVSALQLMLDDLDELAVGSPVIQYDDIEGIRRLLRHANIIMQSSFLLGSASLEEDHSIRIEWLKPDKDATLVVSLNGVLSYIHACGKDAPLMTYEITPHTLAERLDWLSI